MHKIKKHEAIYQGVKDVKEGGWLSDAHLTMIILVPEKNVIAWNKDYLNS